jgi:ubiquinone/menaquinone biosynthesis C-methylase UbiE
MQPLYDVITYLDGYQHDVRNFVHARELEHNGHEKIKILDAGCGSGLVSFALALRDQKHREVTAFDYSRRMISSAQKKKTNLNVENVSFFIGDIERVNPLRDLRGDTYFLEEEEFDYVFAAGALEHVDLPTGVKELTRYLKRGGSFFAIAVIDNAMGNFIGKMLGFTPYTFREIQDAYDSAGLKDMKFYPEIGRFIQGVTARKR